MTFVPFDNFNSVLRINANKTTNDGKAFVDTSGTVRTGYSTSTSFVFSYSYSGTQTAPQQGGVFFYAVEDSTLAHDTYQITPIGTTSQSVNSSNGGYNMVITITGTSADDGKKIRHLVGVKKINYSSSSNADTVLFALKLDTPVELNAENNYTANFTFAIEF